MTFITLASGDELDARYPQARHLQPMVIAWHLAQTNRYCGAARRPYSTAEHALLVCEIAERELHLGRFGQLWALCREAHEFATGHIDPAMAAELGDAWRQHHDRWQRLTTNALGLTAARAAHHEAVRQATLMAMASERKALLPTSATPCAYTEDTPPLPWAVVDLKDPARTKHDWEFWRDRWLDRWHELGVG